jgi:hypothetical protein
MNRKIMIFLSIFILSVQTVYGFPFYYNTQEPFDRLHHAFGFGSIGEIVMSKYILDEKLKQTLRNRKKIFEEEKRNKIYSDRLASRVGGTILKDFLTIRY